MFKSIILFANDGRSEIPPEEIFTDSDEDGEEESDEEDPRIEDNSTSSENSAGEKSITVLETNPDFVRSKTDEQPAQQPESMKP